MNILFRKRSIEKPPSEESSQSSNHLEMSEGVLYRLFLFRRAKRHRPFTGTHVIVFPLPDAKLLPVKVNADMAIDYLPT